MAVAAKPVAAANAIDRVRNLPMVYLLSSDATLTGRQVDILLLRILGRAVGQAISRLLPLGDKAVLHDRTSEPTGRIALRQSPTVLLPFEKKRTPRV